MTTGSRNMSRIALGAIAALCCLSARAQPLVVQVSPRGPTTGEIEVGGTPVAVATLFEVGPSLDPSGYYGYFISPDDKAVVVDLDSRRVVRVLSH